MFLFFQQGENSNVKILSPSIYSNVQVKVDESSSVFCSPIKRVNLKENTNGDQLDPYWIFYLSPTYLCPMMLTFYICSHFSQTITVLN